jgi:hypothetical protein
MKEAIVGVVFVFLSGCLVGSLGQINHIESIYNRAICKQLYKDTETYLKQIQKPFNENITKIKEVSNDMENN